MTDIQVSLHGSRFGIGANEELILDGKEVVAADTGLGAVAGTNVEVAESGNRILNKTVITLTSEELALTDEAGVVAYVGQKIYDMPEGAIMILGATADLTVSKDSAGVNDDFDGDFSVGTVTAGNDATLSSTEANIIPSTATPQATSGATTAKGQSTGAATIDGTTTAADIYLNFLVDDADHDVGGTAANLVVSGTVTILWANLGDY